MLSNLLLLFEDKFDNSILLVITNLMQIGFCLTYLSLGYTALYFQEKKWIAISFYQYPFLMGTISILSFFDFANASMQSVTMIVTTIFLIVGSFKVRNSFIKPYFKYFGFSVIIFYWWNLPKKLFNGSNSLSLLSSQVLRIVPVLIIIFMLYKIIEEIKLLDRQANEV
jgi:hypothetical protein